MEVVEGIGITNIENAVNVKDQERVEDIDNISRASGEILLHRWEKRRVGEVEQERRGEDRRNGW